MIYWKVTAALLSVQMVYAGWNVVGKLVLLSVHPLVFAFWREIVAGFLIALTAFATDGMVCPKPSHHGRFFILGLLTFGQVVLYLVALDMVSPFNASLMSPTIPILTLVIGWFLGVEALNTKKIVGICCAAAGALYVTINSVSGDSAEHTLAVSASHIKGGALTKGTQHVTGNMILVSVRHSGKCWNKKNTSCLVCDAETDLLVCV